MTTLGFRLPGIAEHRPPADIASWAADNGFGALDIGRPDADSVKAIRRAGLEVGTFDLPGVSLLLSPDPIQRQTGVQTITGAAAQARDLGLIKAFAIFLPPDSAQSRGVSFQNWSQSWPKASAALAAAGVDVVMEGWPGPGPHYPALGVAPETVRAMLQVDAARGAGALKLNYDPSHLVRLGIDPLRFLSEFGAYVRHMHGKDTAFDAGRLYETGHLGASLPPEMPGSAAQRQFGFGEGWWRYCVPGDGVLPWPGIAAGLAELGFDGIISVELEDGRYNGSWEGEQRGLRRSREHLARFFA